MNCHPFATSVRRAGAIVILIAGALLAHVPASANDALKLVQAVYDRPAGRDMTTAGRMELVDQGGSRRTREIVTYRQDRGKGEFANLIRFLAPKDISGTGLLSHDKADGSNEQWLYLPGLDRVRRVAGDRKGGRFVGSDIYFEDLQARKPGSDQHRLLGRENIAGTACDIVESIPIDPSSSVYRKRVVWIDAQTAMALRVDYFEKDDTTPTKRWTAASRKAVQGIMTVMDSKTVDLGSGHETRLAFEAVQYNRRLPNKLFTAQILADENIESDYRP
jgi:hypothetical protein